MKKKKKIHLEGSLVVEMKDGSHQLLTCSPFEGMVRHHEPGVGFGPVEITPEAEFRENIKKVVSRSRYDKC